MTPYRRLKKKQAPQLGQRPADMNTNLDLERLRHVWKRNKSADRKAWKAFKNGVDDIGGLIVQSGLVHALLGVLAASGDKAETMKSAADALRDWLFLDKSPVQALAKQACNGAANPGNEDFIFGLMSLKATGDAMAIQAEAIRYLAQAKLLAKAFGSDR